MKKTQRYKSKAFSHSYQLTLVFLNQPTFQRTCCWIDYVSLPHQLIIAAVNAIAISSLLLGSMDVPQEYEILVTSLTKGPKLLAIPLLKSVDGRTSSFMTSIEATLEMYPLPRMNLMPLSDFVATTMSVDLDDEWCLGIIK